MFLWYLADLHASFGIWLICTAVAIYSGHHVDKVEFIEINCTIEHWQILATSCTSLPRKLFIVVNKSVLPGPTLSGLSAQPSLQLVYSASAVIDLILTPFAHV